MHGEDFKEWCHHFSIELVPIMPKWPAANGLCEVFNKILKKILQISNTSNSNLKQEMNALLRNYRSTPHCSTGVAPASLVFVSPNLSRVPCLIVPLSKNANKLTKRAKYSDSMVKRYADKKRRARYHPFKVGQRVFLQKFINQKMYDKSECRFESDAYTIEAIKGAMVTIVSRVSGWLGMLHF